MRRAIIFSFAAALVMAASGAAWGFSSSPGDYSAALVDERLMIFGRLAEGEAWESLPAYEGTMSFGYRCFDEKYQVWKTVGSRTLGAHRVLAVAHLSCIPRDGYCGDPKEAPEKAKRMQFAVYSACRPVASGAREFACEISLKDVPALCDMNDEPAEKKALKLFDAEGFNLEFSLVGGKSYPAQSPGLDANPARSPLLNFDLLFSGSQPDSDGDGIPDPWDR
jgi:hypothetical protein